MNLESKTTGQLEQMLIECRTDRKRLLAIEQEIIRELGYPSEPYPKKTALSSAQIRKLNLFLHPDRTKQEIIEYIEQLLVTR